MQYGAMGFQGGIRMWVFGGRGRGTGVRILAVADAGRVCVRWVVCLFVEKCVLSLFGIG